MRLGLFLALLTFCIPAFAMPPAVAAVALIVAANYVYIQIAILVASYVYGRRQQKKAEARARADYNAGLEDKTLTNVSTSAPQRYVYGRTRVGSNIIAIFTSGDRDQYKHLVCVHADHECDAIEEIYVNNVALGTLDSNGYVQEGNAYWWGNVESAREIATQGTYHLLHTPSGKVYAHARHGSGFFSGETLTFRVYPDANNNIYIEPDEDISSITITYSYINGIPRVRASRHLGSVDQTVDTYLNSLFPTTWPTTARLREKCYTVITLDVNQSEFQSGIPPIEVLLRGKKIYDPRTSTTYWSQNNALVIMDYLTSDMCGVQYSELPESSFIAAANICDTVAPELDNEPLYTCNGSITADQDQMGVLEQLTQSMAGTLVATSWDITAGVYEAPVLALNQVDIVGDFGFSAGLSDADIYNGVQGQFCDSANGYVSTDFKAYQNTAYQVQDGRDIFSDIDFQFTDAVQRIHNLARIFTEAQRKSFTIKADFSLKAWDLKVGDRVTLSNSLLGQTNQVYKVTDKSFSARSPVNLTLKQDEASIWDFADDVTAATVPETNLQNPFVLQAPQNLVLVTGTSALSLQQDGTVMSRIFVSWDLATGVVADYGQVEVAWKNENTEADWQSVILNGNVISTYIDNVLDGDLYTVGVRFTNPALNVKSNYLYEACVVIGKSQAPPDILNFKVTNGALNWSPVTDLDLKGYVLRFHYGSNTFWDSATPMHEGVITETEWVPSLFPSGSITILLKAVDTSGNFSDNPATIYYNFGDVILDNLIYYYNDKLAGFVGDKTNCAVDVDDNLKAFDSGDLFWDANTNPFWGQGDDFFWPTATYLEMEYILTYPLTDADLIGSRLTIDSTVEGQSYTIEYRYDTQGTFWGSGDMDYFWGADTGLFWPQPTEWQTWVGEILSVQVGVIQIKFNITSGTTRGIISELTLNFDVEDEEESFDDISILSAGTRLPIMKSYRTIKNVQITLQDDGGNAVSVKTIDKSATLGPLIKCFDVNELATTGLIDARIQGVKGL